MTKLPIPQPLFDTIENFEDITLNNHCAATQALTFAQNDYAAASDFLKQYSGNKATFESYRREVERLLQWAWLIVNKSILVLKRADIEEYISFCLKPPKAWIAIQRAHRFINKDGERIPNPDWKPFVVTVKKFDHKKGVEPDKNLYQPSQKSVQEIFTVLGSFYNYLILDEKISSNPVALIKQKSKHFQKRQSKASVMRLSELQWQMCLETAQELANTDPEKHERTLFIFMAFYLLYLRISELAESSRWAPQMGHFYQNSLGGWWFKTVGKGNKERDIAVSDDMLKALKRYRRHLGLTALPTHNESTPLIAKDKGQGGITSTRRIRYLVQMCFDKTVEKLKYNGENAEADALEVATVHWLRHTGISDDINKRGRSVTHVRDDAGHSNSGITDRYNDSELTERYASAKHKKADLDDIENLTVVSTEK